LLSGTVMVVIGYALTAVSPWFALALTGVGIAGLFDAIGSVAGYSIIQRRTPDEVRGRVFGSMSSLGLTANALAFIVAGFLVGALGPRAVYGIGAGAALVATIILVRATEAPRVT
jgi:MFS family permease